VGVRGVDDPAGVKLDFVEEEGPASKAGLEVGDVITHVNDREVKDFSTFRRLIAEAKADDELIVKLQRDEKEVSVTVKVEVRRRGR
jgi:S1-C subfamily serine protease